MFLESSRVICREYLDGMRMGRSYEHLCIGICIALGHLEGRPFTAGKIAQYLEVPRTTVLRRVQVLLRRGLIRRVGSYYFLVEERLNRAPALRCHERTSRIVIGTAERLRIKGKGE